MRPSPEAPSNSSIYFFWVSILKTTSSERAANSAVRVDSSSLLKEIPDVMGEPKENAHKFTKVSLLKLWIQTNS